MIENIDKQQNSDTRIESHLSFWLDWIFNCTIVMLVAWFMIGFPSNLTQIVIMVLTYGVTGFLVRKISVWVMRAFRG